MNHAFLYLLFACIMFSPFLIDIYTHYDIFLLQFNNPLISSKTHFTIYTPFVHLLNEHQRLFRKIDIIPLTLLFLFSMIVNYRSLWKEHKLLFLYTITVMICLGLFVEDKQIKYSVLVVPYELLIIFYSFWKIIERNKIYLILHTILFIIVCTVSLRLNVYDCIPKEEYALLNREIKSYMPDHSKCLAPMNYIFNEIDSQYIVGNLFLRQEVHNKNITLNNTYTFCKDKGIEYVVHNKFEEAIDTIQDYADTLELNKHFQVIADNKNYKILKLK